MKKYLCLSVLVFTFYGCAHQKKQVSDQVIETYCQDLNVLYQKINAIEANIANFETTRTTQGGYYRRKIITECHDGYCKEGVDDRAPLLKYLPNHPDADKKGYVAFPNISLSEEKADQMKWMSVYENVVKYCSYESKSIFIEIVES